MLRFGNNSSQPDRLSMKYVTRPASYAIARAVCFAALWMPYTAFAAGTLEEAMRDGPSGVNEFARRTKSCSIIMGDIGNQLQADLSGLRSIADDDYAALCRFGTEVHIPARKRAIDTLIAADDCEYPGDPVTKAVVVADRAKLERMKKIIAKDCRKARISTTSNPKSHR